MPGAATHRCTNTTILMAMESLIHPHIYRYPDPLEQAGTQQDTDPHTYSLMDTGMLIDIHGNPDPKVPDNQITDIQYLLTKHPGTYSVSETDTMWIRIPTHTYIFIGTQGHRCGHK